VARRKLRAGRKLQARRKRERHVSLPREATNPFLTLNSFNSNQNTPLLRLPLELRNLIWAYALGSHTLRYNTTVGRMNPPKTAKACGLDLLRTSRQIYLDTACLPYKLNALSLHGYHMHKRVLKYIKPFQREQFTDVKLEVTDGHCIYLDRKTTSSEQLRKNQLDFLPELKRIHVLMFPPGDHSDTWKTVCKDTVLKQLELVLADSDLVVKFEVMDLPWDKYREK
jgi:hypothetical protein